ncbi:MAG TPA: hypothetical protein H9739_05465 [Candidatus Agathobaculum pullistercoris]|nr:hypothetical protein [uncultured Agathobaculum sp.]HIX11020.1 hypothetical protein [Candidatus Agathobaculum pullistercoris]
MKETISLRTMMSVQAAVALLIPVYYFVMVTYRLRSNVPLFLAIVLLLVIGRLKKRTEAADEYAKQTLRIADSICFRLAVVLMGVILLSLLFMDGSPEWLAGGLLTMGIFLLILIRACVFAWIDRCGMV